MALSPQWLDQLRQRTTLSTLVAQTVPLKRSGNEYKGRCPFHEEKTPSFHVNDAKAFYHCFGCGAHGDAIGWMIDQRGLGFMDAVKELAAAAGLEVPAPDLRARERQEERAGLHDVTAEAARWFSARLNASEGAEPRAYLKRRGVSSEQVAAFAIGYAPDRRDALAGALDETPERLTEAGLLGETDGRRYDRFRDRIIIPIHDARGRVIGFGGRALGEATPKYLNSPDTPLFDKGRTLFNLHRAAPAARKAGRMLVVEGYMDVIALSGVGVEEVVAPLGTALTEAQLELLWRHTDVPMLCFDGDAAGERAAVRAAERALPLLAAGRSLAFVTLPAGQDPDDLVRTGGQDVLEALVAGAEAMPDRLYRAARGERAPSSPDEKAAVRARLDALAASVTDRDLARDYRRALRDRLWADTKPPRFIAGARRRGGPPRRPQLADLSPAARAGTEVGGQEPLLRTLFAALLATPELLGEVAEPLGRLPLSAGPLATLRDALLETAWSGGPLDRQRLAPICAAAGVRFGESERSGGLASVPHIAAAVGAMADLPADERALADCTDELVAADGQRFAVLLAEQTTLRERIARARDDLKELASDHQPAAATG